MSCNLYCIGKRQPTARFEYRIVRCVLAHTLHARTHVFEYVCTHMYHTYSEYKCRISSRFKIQIHWLLTNCSRDRFLLNHQYICRSENNGETQSTAIFPHSNTVFKTMLNFQDLYTLILVMYPGEYIYICYVGSRNFSKLTTIRIYIHTVCMHIWAHT